MEKYYIVPAEIIESNFPDDLDILLENSVVVFETDKGITEIAEVLVKNL